MFPRSRILENVTVVQMVNKFVSFHGTLTQARLIQCITSHLGPFVSYFHFLREELRFIRISVCVVEVGNSRVSQPHTLNSEFWAGKDTSTIQCRVLQTFSVRLVPIRGPCMLTWNSDHAHSESISLELSPRVVFNFLNDCMKTYAECSFTHC